MLTASAAHSFAHFCAIAKYRPTPAPTQCCGCSAGGVRGKLQQRCVASLISLPPEIKLVRVVVVSQLTPPTCVQDYLVPTSMREVGLWPEKKAETKDGETSEALTRGRSLVVGGVGVRFGLSSSMLSSLFAPWSPEVPLTLARMRPCHCEQRCPNLDTRRCHSACSMRRPPTAAASV